MTTVQHICQFLEAFAPLRLAEDWDNVGLLVGDRTAEIRRVMTCLTITPTSAAEAIAAGAGMIVTHHPMPFRPLKRLTADNPTGRMLLQLIAAGVAIYSPHTSFDSAAGGINQRLAEALGITAPQPLAPIENDPQGLGSGRFGRLEKPCSLEELVGRVKAFRNLAGLHVVGELDKSIKKLGVACGAAGQFLGAARREGCDAFVTGETNFHTCLEAEATDTPLVLLGHFESERFALEILAEHLAEEFPPLSIWASEKEADPLKWV